jgi:hypothetical protein
MLSFYTVWLCNNPRAELTSAIKHYESLKSQKLFKNNVTKPGPYPVAGFDISSGVLLGQCRF